MRKIVVQTPARDVWRVTVPREYLVLNAIRVAAISHISRTTEPEYVLAVFMDRYIREVLGRMPSLKCGADYIETDATTAEAILEYMGYTHTVRVKRVDGDDLSTIDEDIQLLWPHANQMVLKTRSEETALLLAIRYELIDGKIARMSLRDLLTAGR